MFNNLGVQQTTIQIISVQDCLDEIIALIVFEK